MNIKSKLKIPKIDLNLHVVLWVILGIVVVLELFVLYKYMIMSILPRRDVEEPQAKVRIDAQALNQAKSRLEQAEQYTLPNYSLQGQGSGRGNPFAEY